MAPASSEIITQVNCPITGRQCTKAKCIQRAVEAKQDFGKQTLLPMPCEDVVDVLSNDIKRKRPFNLDYIRERSRELGISEQILLDKANEKTWAMLAFSTWVIKKFGWGKKTSSN